MSRQTLTIPLRPTVTTGTISDPVPTLPISASDINLVRIPMAVASLIYTYSLPTGCKGFEINVIDLFDRHIPFDLSYTSFGGGKYHTHRRSYYFYGLDPSVSFVLSFRAYLSNLTAQIAILS